MHLYVTYTLFAAAGLLVIAWLWLVVIAFRVRTAWGFGVLLFPPNALIFIPFNWNRAAPPVALGLVALLPLAWAARTLYHVSLSAHSRVVDGEQHLTLTGWNGSDYSLIRDQPDVVVLQMANPNVTDETMQYLEGLQQLRELDLDRTAISDEGLAVLATLPRLRDLRLRGTAITDHGFRKYVMGLDTLMNVEALGTKIQTKTLREWRDAKEGGRRRYVK